MNKHLVTVGDLVVDLLLELRLPVLANAHQTSPSMRIEPGGACTTLLAARNLGLQAAALGTVGDDLPGQMLLTMLAQAGIDTTAVIVPAGSTTTTVISLSDPVQPAHVFLGHYGVSPPIGFTAQAASQIERADAVFIAGYTLAEQRLKPLAQGLLRCMETNAAPLYVDVGPFLGQLEQAEVQAVLRAADVLILTDDEIRFVTAGQRDIDACRRLLREYPGLLIVLKRGPAGCHLLARGLDLPCPGFRADVADTIGAGDAFAAAYIWADLQGYSPAECGTIGNAMGAASVAKAGAGRNAPTRAEAQRVLDANQTGIKLTCR